MRIVLVGQDLSGRAIQGEPFSYVGNCTGTDIKFTGDWRHMSLFGNTFIRPDWSQAKTRWSYCRFNNFSQIRVSDDVDILDHGMLGVYLLERAQALKGVEAKAALAVGRSLAADRLAGANIKSWANYATDYIAALGGAVKAEAAFRTWVEGKEHLVQHLLRMAHEDKTKPSWDEVQGLDLPDQGIASSDWGIGLRRQDGQELRVHWPDLPALTNPHDRVEMDERLEAAAEKFLGYPVTVYVVSIVPWRCRTMAGTYPREVLAP